MTIRYILPVVFFFLTRFAAAQEFTYRKTENQTFGAGEKLTFKVYYESLLTGKINAGTASLEVKNTKRHFDNREVYHIIGAGRSNPAFDLFFKVRDRYETYMDKDALIPHLFIRRTKEGGYVKNDDIYFDHKNGLAKSSTATKPVPPNIQDIISAAYYVRTIDFSHVAEGENFSVDFYLDDSAYVSVIQFVGREVVETDLGIFRCLAFKPMMATGEVFSNPYPMKLWITDDKNKLPVLAKSEVIIGSVVMELTGYSGLLHPLDARIEKKKKAKSGD